MNKYDSLSGLFLMAASIGTCIMAHRLGLGNIGTPGSGLIPFGIAALLGLMSIGMVLKNLPLVIRAHEKNRLFKGIRWKTLVLVLSTLLGYGIALNTLGFIFCTFLLMMFLLGMVGRKKWWWTLSFSIFITVVAYIIFVVWLSCEFPRGFWVSIIEI